MFHKTYKSIFLYNIVQEEIKHGNVGEVVKKVWQGG
jgi:hypothetical protein